MWIDDINNAEPKLMSVLLYMMLSNHNTINLPLYVYQRVLVWTVPTGTKNEDVNKSWIRCNSVCLWRRNTIWLIVLKFQMNPNW